MKAFRAALLAASASLMISAAHAQEAVGEGAGAPAGGGGGSLLMQQLLMFAPIILIFYFLLIRPQQQRAKKHREMIETLQRGDVVVTSGGMIGKVVRVDETEITVEVADNVRIRVVKGTIMDVRGKGVPAAANDSKPE